MDEIVSQLQEEYCPPLDSALFSAIVSDYDLTNNEGLNSARSVLHSLKEDATLEDDAGFDPSGTGASADTPTDSSYQESPFASGASLSLDTDTPDTEVSGLAKAAASLGLEDEPRGPPSLDYNADLQDPEKLDENTKLQWLFEMFGEQLSKYSIQFALKKSGGKWHAAVEELLNQAYYLEQSNANHGLRLDNKGIDAFSEDNDVGRARKSKTKKKRRKRNAEMRRSSSLPGSADGSPVPSSNKWNSAREDIDFIANRTSLSSGTIASVYFERGANTSATIGALLKASLKDSGSNPTNDLNVSERINQLGSEFPRIKAEYLTALIRVARPSIEAARELAEVLTAEPSNTASGGIQIIPQYSQPNLDCEDYAANALAEPRGSSSTSRTALGWPEPTASLRREAYTSAAETAYAQASAAHRKAKSDRLMGGAAAYYADERRRYAALSSAASADVADAIALSQSRSTELDLHGIDVLNAVRIARIKTEEWWRDLEEARFNGRVGAASRQSGFKIVVGAGRHSEGGKGKLGPAVTKSLTQEGWKVEPAGAVLIVKGPKRK